MNSPDLVAALAEQLDQLVPPEPTAAPDWEDIVRRVVPAPAPQRKRRRLRLVVVAIALFLLLAGIATGTYFALRESGRDRADGLTLFTGDPTPYAPCKPKPRLGLGCGPFSAIGAVQPDGRLRIIWRCPHPGYACGEMNSLAWSRDGRKLAFTMTSLNHPGSLHIADTITGRDLRLPRAGPGTDEERATRDLGCVYPSDVAWSADGHRLAYVCGPEPFAMTEEAKPGIFVISADGSRRVAAPAPGGHFPSWSPDGYRLAFATGNRPTHSSVYVVNLDGSGRTLVARNATAPAWSPDGRAIAYRSTCGLRLSTPTGTDVTPPILASECAKIRRESPGSPAWSPDGTRLAFAGPDGVYVVNADGTGLTRVTSASGRSTFGPVRPAWTPTPRVVHSRPTKPVRQRCC